MKLNFVRFLAAFLVVWSSNAFASVINFDLVNEGEATVEHELFLAEMGVTLSVTGWTTSHNTEQQQLEPWQQVLSDGDGIFYADRGLGLFSGDDDGAYLDGGSSSNYASDPDEGFLLSFSRRVSILGLLFDFVDSSDDINLSMLDVAPDGSFTVTETLYDLEIFNFADEVGFLMLVDPTMALTGRHFMVWVDGSSDGLSLVDVVVETVPETHIAALFLFVFGMFAIQRIRRNRIR